LKILLIQLRRLGDLILMTLAISALREHLPGAQIALAVSHECESLLPAIQGIQKTFLTKRGLRDLSTWMQIPRGLLQRVCRLRDETDAYGRLRPCLAAASWDFRGGRRPGAWSAGCGGRA